MINIEPIMNNYVEEIKKIYGKHLQRIILYGSYARGEATEASDIDIMILVNLDDMAIKDYSDELSSITFDINLDNDLMIMPIVKNEDHFKKWINAYPFYRNVEKEGVPLYAA
ncbi:MAG: nucleotidyltransferase domain-containing protein [Eubacterium sp.]